jgi:hypothetical protein
MKNIAIIATVIIQMTAVMGCSDSPGEGPPGASDAALPDTDSNSDLGNDANSDEGWQSTATVQPDNVLRYKISHSAPEGIKAKIQWWKSGSETVRTTACYAGDITLWDMEPKSTYEYRVMPCDKEGWGKLETFTTQALPDGFPTVDLTTPCTNCQTNYILTNVGGRGGAYAIILNVDGSIRWYQTMEKVEHTFFDVDSGRVYAQQNHRQQKAFSLAGEETLSLEYGTGTNPRFIHHDSLVADGKLYMVIARRHAEPSLAKYIVDGVDVYDLAAKDYLSTWTVDSVFSASDFETMGSQGPGGYWATQFGSGDGTVDWAHMNSLALAKGGDFLASFRQLGVNGYEGRVVLFDKTTGQIIWSLGDSADFALTSGDWFATQHHAHFVSDDTIMLFDNTGLKQESRVLQIKLTFNAGVPEGATYVREQKLGQKCGSRSAAYLYDTGDHLNDAMIVTCAPSAVFSEYGGSGEMLWQLRLRSLGDDGKEKAATGVYRGVPILSLPQP